MTGSAGNRGGDLRRTPGALQGADVDLHNASLAQKFAQLGRLGLTLGHEGRPRRDIVADVAHVPVGSGMACKVDHLRDGHHVMVLSYGINN